jgi:hypothetical protein
MAHSRDNTSSNINPSISTSSFLYCKSHPSQTPSRKLVVQLNASVGEGETVETEITKSEI